MYLNYIYLNGYFYFLLFNDWFIKKILNVIIFYVYSVYVGCWIFDMVCVNMCVIELIGLYGYIIG